MSKMKNVVLATGLALAAAAGSASAAYGYNNGYSGAYNSAYGNGAYNNGAYYNGAYNNGAYNNGAYNNGAYNNSGYNNGAYNNSGYNNGYNNAYGRTLRCESRDNRTVYCGVDTRGGVSLVQQISKSSCIRGRTWGADGRGIWVARGCRATFAINDRYQDGRYGYNDNRYGNAYSSRTVRCESRDGRTNYCNLDTRAGVSIVTQRSDRPCIQGRTWGVSSGNQVWVTGGCRADFASGSSQYGYNQGYYDRRY